MVPRGSGIRRLTVRAALLLIALAATPPARAQVPGSAAAGAPQGPPPTLEEVRREMGIPSRSLELRGQRDSIGFAWNAAQMARVWELSATPPAPDSFGPLPPPGVAAVICPHDDFLYAGRVYRRVLPLLTARTVILVGVFHRYRRFGARDRLVFDRYRGWRAPDGPVRVSGLRDILLGGLAPADFVQDAAMHDSEHSLEALAHWLKHLRPEVEIVPIIVPAASFERLEELAESLGRVLATTLAARELELGRDVAIAISADGIHYGPDFRQTAFGDSGQAAYEKATAKDHGLLNGSLRGGLTRGKIRRLYETFVDPKQPDTYRWTWCGRFSVPFGLMLLRRVTRDLGQPVGHPVAYATSVGWPELPVRDLGLGATAPASLAHFVGYPGVAFTLDRSADLPARNRVVPPR